LSAKADVQAAKFNVKSAEASVKEAKDNLFKTTVFSPVDGTVSKLNVELGERVLGTSQMTGTEIMRIANLNSMEVSVDVNENDINRLSIGDTATVEVDAFLDQSFKGVVTEIANSASVVGASADQVTNFPVKIRILSESYSKLNSKIDSMKLTQKNEFRIWLEKLDNDADLRSMLFNNYLKQQERQLNMNNYNRIDVPIKTKIENGFHSIFIKY
jgi:molybdopterin-binding protein